jgi:hypothetical protein
MSHGEPDDSPHSPHSPRSDSNWTEMSAEGAAGSSSTQADPPRCEDCGMLMSVVRVSSLCGNCQRRRDAA